MPYTLELQLNVDATKEQLSTTAVRWLDEMYQALAPGSRGELAALPAQPAGNAPGAVSGVLAVVRQPPGRRPVKDVRRASDAGMSWLREELREVPRKARLWLGRTDERGGEQGRMLELQVHRYTDVPEWLDLKAYVDEAAFTDPDHGSENQRRYLDAMFPFADELAPGYGQIAYPINEGATAYEYCLRDPQHKPPVEWWLHPYTLPYSREFLRGYSWLTVIPEDLVATLGSAGALRDSGAFAEVRTLGGGGAWLLATADYREFTDEALARVAKALAPALRPGPLTKWPPRPGGPPLRIVV